jgi:hypothetical protein
MIFDVEYGSPAPYAFALALACGALIPTHHYVAAAATGAIAALAFWLWTIACARRDVGRLARRRDARRR